MAGLRDLLNGGKDYASEALRIAKPLAKDYPIVAEILGGLPEKGDQASVSAGTITFFIHEGKMRFSANVKGAEKTFIGEVGDPLNPWGCVNSAMLVGDVSSKRYTDRKASMTDEQKTLLL